MALLIIGGFVIQSTERAHAQCVWVDTTLTCTGSVVSSAVIIDGQKLVLPDGPNTLFRSGMVVAIGGDSSSIDVGSLAKIGSDKGYTIQHANRDPNGPVDIWIRGLGTIENTGAEEDDHAILASVSSTWYGKLHTRVFVEEFGNLTASAGSAINVQRLSVENEGTIQTRQNNHAIIAQYGTIINGSTGVISNASDAVDPGGSNPSSRATIYFREGGAGKGIENHIKNYGTIKNGGTGAAIRIESSSNDTLINAGTIASKGSHAIHLGTGSDILELWGGFTIQGITDAGEARDLLRFAGPNAGQFDLDEIDSKYQNFEHFQVAGGDWTMVGATDKSFDVTGGILHADGKFGGIGLLGGYVEVGPDGNIGKMFQQGGELGGTGKFGELVLAGGVTSPGTRSDVIGTMVVERELLIKAGATYQVDVQGDKSDRINVGGKVKFEGDDQTLSVIFSRDNLPTKLFYTIIQSENAVIGSFASVVGNLPDVGFEVDYSDPKSVQLKLTSVPTSSPPEPSAEPDTPNPDEPSERGTNTPPTTVSAPSFVSPKQVYPSSIAAGMQAVQKYTQTLLRRTRLVTSRGLGETTLNLAGGFAAASQTPAAFSGAPHYLGGAVQPWQPTVHSAWEPTVVKAAWEPTVRQAGWEPTDTSAAWDPLVKAARKRLWAMWGAVLGSTSEVDKSVDGAGWDNTIQGVVFGFERAVSNAFGQVGGAKSPAVIGLSSGYTVSDVNSEASSSNIDSYHLGVYAGAEVGNFQFSSAITYAWQDHDVMRRFSLADGSMIAANGQTSSTSLVAAMDLFYNVTGKRDGLGWGPVFTVEAINAHFDSFTESGIGILNLTVHGSSASQMTTGLGFAARFNQTVAKTRLHFDARVVWEHVFGDRFIATQSSIQAPGGIFVTTSAPIASDRIAFGFGAGLDVTDAISSHLRYDGAISGSSSEHSGSAGVTVKF